MTDKQPSGAQQMFGDFAPGLVDLTDNVLFGQVWERTELSPRDRSLITVASLVTSGATEQLVHHLGRARDNGATEQELTAGQCPRQPRNGYSARNPLLEP